MSSHGPDKVFAGSIPKFYEAYLVPLLFEPYAADLAAGSRRGLPAACWRSPPARGW